MRPKMTRKIIQLSAAHWNEGGGYDPAMMIFALCDDGTTWFRELGKPSDAWEPLPAIPQDQP